MKFRYQHGQSLVLMAILMVALVAILAVALDLGYVYAMRRGAQNAADAGALAGAHTLCLNLTLSAGYRDALAIAEAKKWSGDFYVPNSTNRVPAAVVQTAAPSVDDGERAVTVVVSVNYDTLLGASNLIGSPLPNNTIQAIASARCSPTDTAKGALPIAKFCPHDPIIIDGVSYETCGIDFGAMDDTCDVGVDKFTVFLNESNSNPSDPVDDILDETATYWCEKWPNQPAGSITVNCDIPGGIPGVDDSNDIDPVMTSNPQHSWIWTDLSPDGDCTNSSCMVDEVNGTKVYSVSTHTWVNGGSGGHTTVYKAIENYRLDPGDYVIIPFFDDRCMGNPETPSADCAGRVHPQDKYYVGNGINQNDVFFHLNTFGIFKVTCVDDGGKGKCIARKNMFDQKQGSAIKDPPKIKSFEGCFVGGFVPQLTGQSDETYYTGGFSVYLNR
jgi:Flp pilus assembly protein TadG